MARWHAQAVSPMGLVALNTVQLARRDFLFSDHDQVRSTPEDLCAIRAQNCALFLLTYIRLPEGYSGRAITQPQAVCA